MTPSSSVVAEGTCPPAAAARPPWPVPPWAVEVLPAGVAHTDRPRWLAERANGIGASEVAAVLGLTPWESEYGLWMLKTGRRPPIPDTYVLERGRRLEAACAQWFADESKLHLTSTGTWAMRGHPHLRCSPDRFTSDGGGLECKTAGEDWAKQWADGYPALHAQAQVLWTLAVLGLPHWYLAAMTEAAFKWWRINATGPLDDPRWRAIVPSGLAEDVIQWMVETVDNWWWEYVVGDKEPDVDASDATREALHEAYAAAETNLIQLRPEVVFPGSLKLQRRRLALKAKIKSLQDELQGIENPLKAGLEHALTALDYDEQGRLVPVLTWDLISVGKPNQTRRFKEPKL